MVFKRDSPNLDILRAFAVTGVLVHHLAQLTPRGQEGGAFALWAMGRTGVLIFFVHTALVLMGSLERLEARGGDAHLLRAFYVQRIFRLYPLSVSCVAAVLAVHWAVPSLHLSWLTGRAAVANFLLVQNLTWDRSIISPLWSLPYEMQMYVVLPLIFFLTKRRRAFLYLGLLWVGAALGGSYLYWADPRYARTPFQYPLLWFVPTFLGGVFAYLLLRRRHATLPAAWWPVLIVSLFVIFQVCQIRRPELLMSLLGFAIPQFQEVRNGVARLVAHNVAKYSYGIYLLHLPLLEFCFGHVRAGVGVKCGLFFFLLAVCSVGAYHFIEKPMIDVGHWFGRRIVREERVLAETVREEMVREGKAARAGG